MYRIYMPVDLVLAISHKRLHCDRREKHNCSVDVVKVNDANSVNDVNKNKSCLDIFRIW